jgi:hypothetical protein
MPHCSGVREDSLRNSGKENRHMMNPRQTLPVTRSRTTHRSTLVFVFLGAAAISLMASFFLLVAAVYVH